MLPKITSRPGPIRRWRERRAAERALARLPDYLLDDIGLLPRILPGKRGDGW